MYRLNAFTCIWLVLSTLGLSSPSETQFTELQHHSKRAEDFYLRILPLGASITWGLKSETNNGYRKPLRDQLRWVGWNVNMVGSKHNGEMNDDDVEARSGDVVAQVQAASESSIRFLPNVVLINAGTNDCTKEDLYIPNVRKDMEDLIDNLQKKIPDVTIILSTLLPTTNPISIPHLGPVNDDYRALVKERRDNGQKIVLADMNDGFLTVDDLVDGTHPNDYGYSKMASVWWDAILEAQKADFLTAPHDTPLVDDASGSTTTCDKEFGSGMEHGPVETQRGSGSDDDTYVHDSTDMKSRLTITRGGSTNFFFAKIYDPALHDVLAWDKDANGNVVYSVWRNRGDGNFEEVGAKLDVHDGCIARGVHWVDMNADGLDDFVCIGREGNLYAAINQGGGSDDAGPEFVQIGQLRTMSGDYNQDNVRLADIDGDGHFDYCIAHGNGDIYCDRNGGQGDAPEYWQPLGLQFEGKDKGDLNGVRFVDINGDGRSDWLWLDDKGKTDTYINNRGCNQPDGSNWMLGVDWRDAGETHAGMDEEGARDNIHFAKVYGVDGRYDYIYVTSSEGDNGDITYDFNVWRNDGSGGTMVRADGNRYADITGDGKDDYVWVSPDGKGQLFENYDNWPYWHDRGIIFDTGMPRDTIHLGDWDGDGRADVLSVDYNSGQVRVWKNNWDNEAHSGEFEDLGVPNSDLKCAETKGVGVFDLPVRFADITGNHMVDYLCLEPNGRTTGFLNQGDNKFEDVGQIKFSEGKDRANLRWADVNGDGKEDLLWIDKFMGDTSVWYNAGQIPVSGSAFTWTGKGALYQGAAQGACQYYPNLGGLGRADFHVVDARTNTAQTWFNVCPNGGNGDDGPLTDPKLPVRDVDRWKAATCSDDGVTDATQDPNIRWYGVDAEGLWNAALDRWHEVKDDDEYSFSKEVSTFFNMEDGMSCEALNSESGCSAYPKCADAAEGSYAGSFMILGSFSSLHNAIWDFYQGIDDTDELDTRMSNVAATFGPAEDDQRTFNLIMDALGIAFSVFAAPVFNNFLKNLKYFADSASAFDNVKEVSNGLASWAVSIAKDAKVFDSLTEADQLSTLATTMVSSWKTLLTELNKNLFDGNDEGLELLHKTIAGGKMMANERVPLDDVVIEEMMNKALDFIMIPQAWYTSDQHLNPVVVATGVECTETTNEDIGDYDNPDDDQITDNAFSSSSACVDGQVYSLAAAKGTGHTCTGHGNTEICHNEALSTLPGIDKLTGDEKDWHGFHPRDFVVAAVNSYNAMGGKNGGDFGPILDFSDPDDLGEINIHAPGFNTIPVCDMEEAWYNYLAGDSTANYPCD
ncbi:hypothetical protein FQN54_008716 [Arachnomyces sp. PD_36]|nr:hypothetical protein FQN54_008716 [Arachnomyces sp. PD_36]